MTNILQTHATTYTTMYYFLKTDQNFHAISADTMALTDVCEQKMVKLDTEL